MDIAKFLKTLILKKICEQLLLNNVKQNFIHEDCQIGVKCLSTFAGKHLDQSVFLINIVVACNLSLSLFKKRFRQWCFPDSFLKFLTTTFLKREKKHCYKKRSIVIRNVDQISITNQVTQLFM